MSLPPEVEAKLAACEADVRLMQIERLSIEQSVDAFISQGDVDEDDAIPEETFDDPSIVREVQQLRRVERRVTRSSDPPANVPALLSRGR